MELLFSNMNQERIGDTSFIEHYTGINNSMAVAKMKPAIRQATQLKVLKFVSQTYYDAFAARFVADTLTAQEALILDTFQDAIAHYSIVQKLDEGNASLSELGLTYQNDDMGTSQVSQWQFFAAKYDLTKKADAFLERFLAFVYDNTDDFTAFLYDFDLYFIRSPRILSKYIPISNSVMTFFNIQASIRKLSEQQLKTMITSDLYDTLLNAVRTNTFTDIQTKLLDKVNAWLAPGALLHAVPFLNIDLSDGKLFSVTTNDGYRNRQAARESQVNLLLSQLREDMQAAENDLVVFLNENSDDLGFENDILEVERVVEGTNSVGLF